MQIEETYCNMCFIWYDDSIGYMLQVFWCFAEDKAFVRESLFSYKTVTGACKPVKIIIFKETIQA